MLCVDLSPGIPPSPPGFETFAGSDSEVVGDEVHDAALIVEVVVREVVGHPVRNVVVGVVRGCCARDARRADGGVELAERVGVVKDGVVGYVVVVDLSDDLLKRVAVAAPRATASLSTAAPRKVTDSM